MSMDRRKFLKVAGLSTLIGLGGSSAFEMLRPGKVDAEMKHEGHHGGHHGEGHEKAEEAGPKTRWAMLIDMQAITKEKAEKIVHTCHQIHNVPDWGNPKDEIKWFWEDEYEHVFVDSYNE